MQRIPSSMRHQLPTIPTIIPTLQPIVTSVKSKTNSISSHQRSIERKQNEIMKAIKNLEKTMKKKKKNKSKIVYQGQEPVYHHRFDHKDHSFIQINIDYRQFELGMITLIGIVLIGLNVFALKFGYCVGKGLNTLKEKEMSYE